MKRTRLNFVFLFCPLALSAYLSSLPFISRRRCVFSYLSKAHKNTKSFFF
ncbi:hypothetical protein GHT06_012833 [Daphnia sinensis]|uniref:Uncharacterized protein n=1 Tax=Daphnia sinensis TaxID=1820382 RepID=A0AAD5PW23_9CRUS|nr:hypothetical protein GHT06_012833 [Daphnia sinensis]